MKFAKWFFIIIFGELILGLIGGVVHKDCLRNQILEDLITAWFNVGFIERLKFFGILYFSAFLEEFVFRYLPNKFLPKFLSFLISSFLFGYLHRFLIIGNEVFVENNWLFHFVAYSFLGMLFHLSYQEMGLKKNINLHFLTNATIFALNVLLRVPP